MAENDRSNVGPAIGFWKFVIVGTVVLSILRGILFRGSIWSAKTGSMFWFAIFLYGAYRVARLQPWWPFRYTDPGYRQVQVSRDRESRLKNPITADTLRRTAVRTAKVTGQAAAKTVKMAAPVFKKQVLDAVYAPSSPKGVLLAQTSTVGLRSRAVRQKTVRRKMRRQKRRPV